jgi:hypothetical protein
MIQGQGRHGCARTIAVVHRAIQSSQESLIALAAGYDIRFGLPASPNQSLRDVLKHASQVRICL